MTEQSQIITWSARAVMEIWTPEATAFAAQRLSKDASRVNSEGRVHVTADDLIRFGISPEQTISGPIPGNRLTTIGLTTMTDRLFTATQVWTPSTGTAGSEVGFTGMGVGTGTGSADAIGDTNLNGSSKAFRVCDTGFPTRSSGVLTFKTTFADTEANFTWDEYCVIVPGSGAAQLSGVSASTSLPSNYKLLNSKRPAALGTKNSGGAASITLVVTLT